MKKELVKSNSITDTVAKEVESLCEEFTWGAFLRLPNGDSGGDIEILF